MQRHYLVERTYNGTVELVVTGEWNAATTRAVREERYDRLVLNYARGFQERNLDVLIDLPIRNLMVLARTVRDIDGLYALRGTLEGLSITSGAAEVRLDLLPGLTSISADWSTIDRSISSATSVEVLGGSGFPDNNLEGLSSLARLKTLWLTECRELTTLDGLEGLQRLRELSIHGAAQLQDVTRLRDVRHNPLQALTISGASRIGDYEPVFELDGLESLELSDCGPIPSLVKIAHLRRLEDLDLHGRTSVLDNDLSPVLELPRLSSFAIRDVKAYVPRRRVIEQILASRA